MTSAGGGGGGGTLAHPFSGLLDTVAAAHATKGGKKRAGYVFQPLEKRLAQSEVDFDLRELNGVLEAAKKRRVELPGVFTAVSLLVVRRDV